jgi:hypothetical protein
VFIGSLLLTPVLVGHVSDAVVLLWVYLAVFVTNAAGQYFNQGRLALVAVSVPAEARTAAFRIQGVAVNLLSIVGPPLAAPLLFSVGVYPALALNAVSFLLSSAILSRVAWDDTKHASPGVAGSFWSSLAEGAKAVSSNRVLSTLVVSLTIATFAAGALNVLEVFFVTDVLHVAASVVGVLLMGYAAGNVVGGLVAARLERRFGAAPTFAALSVFPTVASLVAMATTGWLASTVLRGFSIQLGATHFGPVDTIFFVAGLLMIVAGVWAGARLGRSAATPATTPAAVPAVRAERT